MYLYWENTFVNQPTVVALISIDLNLNARSVRMNKDIGLKTLNILFYWTMKHLSTYIAYVTSDMRRILPNTPYVRLDTSYAIDVVL